MARLGLSLMILMRCKADMGQASLPSIMRIRPSTILACTKFPLYKYLLLREFGKILCAIIERATRMILDSPCPLLSKQEVPQKEVRLTRKPKMVGRI